MADGRLTRRGAIGGAAAGAAAAALPGQALAKGKGGAGSAKTRYTDVVVVGAGLAGLTAALRLKQSGRRVIVLEARNRVGGRTLNHPLGGGRVAELGGMFTGPTQDHIQALAKEMGVGTYPTYNQGNNVYIDSDGHRSVNSNTIPEFGTAPVDAFDPSVDTNVATVVTDLDNMAATINPDDPTAASNSKQASNIASWDQQTLAQWVAANSTPDANFTGLVSAATEPIFGCEPWEISLLYTLFYIASSGDEQNPGTFERNFDTQGGAQQDRFVGGAQEISIRVAKRLGKRVILNTPVRKIRQAGGQVIVTSDAVTVHARAVIVAMPPALCARIDYEPQLPPLRDQLTQHMPQGSLMKFEAIYDTPFWRAAGYTGQSISNNGPVKVTFDTTPQQGTPGIMMGFIGGHEARYWMQQSPAALRSAVLAQYRDFYDDDAALSPKEVVTFNWSAEEWNRGCPVALLSPGTMTDFYSALRAPIGRIHWAGTETSNYWNGYMDGAVRSGERAAAEVGAKVSKAPPHHHKKKHHHRRR